MKKAAVGFTLLELLIAIAIVGILAAILVPNLLQARARAHDVSAAGCAKQISAGQEAVFIDSQAYAPGLGVLNSSSGGMAENCEASWVDDSTAFTDGWEVQHPNGSGLVYTVGPGGIVPPP